MSDGEPAIRVLRVGMIALGLLSLFLICICIFWRDRVINNLRNSKHTVSYLKYRAKFMSSMYPAGYFGLIFSLITIILSLSINPKLSENELLLWYLLGIVLLVFLLIIIFGIGGFYCYKAAELKEADELNEATELKEAKKKVVDLRMAQELIKANIKTATKLAYAAENDEDLIKLELEIIALKKAKQPVEDGLNYFNEKLLEQEKADQKKFLDELTNKLKIEAELQPKPSQDATTPPTPDQGVSG